MTFFIAVHPLSESDYGKVLTAVYHVRAKWRQIALMLDLTKVDIDNIHHSDNCLCLIKILTIWLKRPSLQPNWEKLVKALKTEVVNEGSTAEKIEEEFVNQGSGVGDITPSPSTDVATQQEETGKLLHVNNCALLLH